MRKTLISWTSVTALCLLSTAIVMAEDEIDLNGVKCVINAKGDAKATSSAEYKGATVFFCCDGCKGKFTKEPKEFAAAANAQLVATKQAKQVKCPLTGMDVKEGVTVKVSDLEIGLCCGGCQKKLADMETKEQLETAFGDKSFEKGFELAKKDAEKDTP